MAELPKDELTLGKLGLLFMGENLKKLCAVQGGVSKIFL
jgi:hypothetical protein